MDNQTFPQSSAWKHLPRFYFPDLFFRRGNSFELDRQTVQHAIHARRLKVGQYFILFDGRGTEYLAQMESIGKNQASACWKESQQISRESPLNTTLVMALIASDKMDWVIQKATELGVTSIQPIITVHSFKLVQERWVEKHRHWKEIAVSACEQCTRNIVPTIHSLMKFEDWLQDQPIQHSLSYVMSPFAEKELSSVLHEERENYTLNPLRLIVGPEGGLSPLEETKLMENGWQGFRLGSRILRAETAALAALSCIQFFQ